MFKFLRCAGLVCVYIGLNVTNSYAQTAFSSEDVESYVIIGAFKVEGNANRFSRYYASRSLPSEIKWNKNRQLFYVFSFHSSNLNESRGEVLEVRSQYPNLSDAWLYNGDFINPHIPSDKIPQNTNETTTSTINPAERLVEEVEEFDHTDNNTSGEVTEPITQEPEVVEEVPKPVREKKEGIYNVYFNTYNSRTFKEVEGKVAVFDAVRAKKINDVQSQKTIEINDPNNGAKSVKFSSDIFGYREVEVEMNLDDPSNSGVENVKVQGDSIIIDMAMERYNKGDIMTMWRVFFYIDAAIMKEESVLELNQLLNMLHEDEKLRIRIHGHTNGNSHGDVLHLDLDDKSFFSLNGTHKKAKASAKTLSLFRAHTIKYWLMDQGIAEDRMELKGWGGKKMLHDKHSSQADENVRVEIEILEN